MNPDTLRTLRVEAGLSQTELAAKAGVNASIVSRLESGERVTGSVSTLRALAEALADSLDRDLGEIMVALTDPR